MICYVFATLLQADTHAAAVSTDDLVRMRDVLSQSSEPMVGEALQVLYDQVRNDNFSNRMHLLPRPTNWMCWGSEKICDKTSIDNIKIRMQPPTVSTPEETVDGEIAGLTPLGTGGPADTAVEEAVVAVISPPAAPFIHRAASGVFHAS